MNPTIIWLFLCFSFFVPMSDSKCSEPEQCQFLEWMSWGICQGSCGFQNQTRMRTFCCPDAVVPKTMDTCLGFCNQTWNPDEAIRECHICIHGRRKTYNTCSCFFGYKGECCQGNNFIMIISS